MTRGLSLLLVSSVWPCLAWVTPWSSRIVPPRTALRVTPMPTHGMIDEESWLRLISDESWETVASKAAEYHALEEGHPGSFSARPRVDGGKAAGRGRGQQDAEVFQSILDALKVYRAIHGDLLIARDFVVPENEEAEEQGWDAIHQGWRLGQRVYNMDFWKEHVLGHPERRQALDELGFVWGRLQDEYNIFLEALLVYRELHDSLLIPHHFVVPSQDPWPMACRGLKLGAQVSLVRRNNCYVKQKPERWYQLHAMGFVWDLSEKPFNQVHEALHVYKTLNLHLNVPQKFRVPSYAPWPEHLWGLKLGQKVQAIRASHLYIRHNPVRIRKLNDLGFQWLSPREASYNRVLKAYKAFKNLNGSGKVPSSFVVPCAQPWPADCWGMRLGTTLVDIRSKGRYLMGKEGQQRRAQMERLGVFDGTGVEKWNLLVSALRAYTEVYGDAAVAQRFTVPAREPWPPACWDLKLGRRLYMLRRKPERLDAFPSIRRELEELGFQWEMPQRGFRKRAGPLGGAAPAAAPAPTPPAQALVVSS